MCGRTIQEETSADNSSEEGGAHDHLPLPYQSLDEQGVIIDVNQCWLDTLGYTRGEVIGTWFGDLLPSGQQQTFKETFPRFKEQGSIQGVELQLLKKDGGILHALFNGRVAYSDDGSIERTHCMFEDITNLKETEERFRHLYEHATVGLYQTTPDGRITMANPAAVDMLGYDSFEELAERDLENTGYEPGYPRSIFKKAMEEDGEVHGLESAWKRKDGSTIYVRESAKAYYNPDGSIRCYEGSIEDITEQKKAEKKLREIMERYQALYQRSMDAVYVHDLEGQLIDGNRAALDMLGYTKQELTALSFEELLTEDQLPLAYETLEKIRETGAQDELTEFHLRCKDGSPIWVETTASLIYRDGEPYAVQGVARDITAEKKAREKIRRRTEAIESSIDGIAILNAAEEYVYLNQAHARIYGYGSPDELQGKTWHMLYDEAWRQRFEEEFMPRLRRQGHWRGEAVGRKKDGSTFPQEVSLTALEDGGLICVVRDITERKETMAKLRRHTENMEYLADAAREFMEQEEEAYEHIASCIHRQVEEGIVIVNSYDEESKLSRVQAVMGMDGKLEKISEVLGRHPVGMQFPLKSSAKEEMLSGRLMTGPSGLHELSGGKIPRPVAAMLDRLVGVEQIYEMGLTRQDSLYGNVVVITTSPEARVETEVLEALIGQASIWLERHRAVQALRESERKYRTLFENMAQGVFYQRRDGTFVDVNQAALDMFGLTRDEFLGRAPAHPDWHVISDGGVELSPDERPSEMALATGRPVTDATVGAYNPDKGAYTWMNVNAIPQFREGESQPYRVFVTMQDVTEQKQAHLKLKQSLEEKEILLREVHHRVKNNLQVISSMLQMESMQHDDPEASQALQDMQLRIKSMGLVHEHLHQSPDLSHVDVRDYLSQLAYNVMQTYSPGDILSLDLDLQDVELPLDKAIPCGLITTELLSNAFRHAFPDDRTGTVHLSVRRSDGTCTLAVSDDGVGIGEAAGDSETLGLQLVDILAAQLDGTIEFTHKKGTTATLTFPLPCEVAA